MGERWHAGQLVALLEKRHAQDVFVAECKTGPTWTGRPIRLDAWAMKRSWAKPVTWGYEIKVSRSDFLRDDKWQEYLPYCTDFAFVCPAKLIMPNELPTGVGLVWATGSRLYTKVKAARRHEAETPAELLIYVLMSRARIDARDILHYGCEDKADRWRRWLASLDSDKDLGNAIAQRITEKVRARVGEVETESRRLEMLMQGYDDIRHLLRTLGLSSEDVSWAARNTIKRLVGAGPDGFLADVKRAREALEKIELEARVALAPPPAPLLAQWGPKEGAA